jgi:predicted amidohydrolase YtcJ
MFLTPTLLDALRALDLPVVTQPSFVHDLEPAGAPPGLWRLPLARLRDAGIPQAFSSDHPCGSLAPLTGLHAAVTRRTRSGARADDEAPVPPGAALAAYTLEAARVMGLDAECGSLAPGKRADLVVLDRDPLGTPADGLGDVAVVRTYVGGRQVWP